MEKQTTMIKNKIIIYYQTNRIAEYEFDGYDADSIECATESANKKIESYFAENDVKELNIMTYNENGDCKIKTIPNKHYQSNVIKNAYLFSMSSAKENGFCNLAVFDNLKVAKSKMIDWFTFNHDEFEDDEVKEIVDELISSNQYGIDDSQYYFEEMVMNQC